MHSPDFPVQELRDSRAFFGLYAAAMGLIAAAFAANGWVVLAAVTTGVAGWGAARMVVNRVRVRVTEEGIEDTNFWYSPGFIGWDEIIEVREGRWGVIEIDLRDETGFWNRLSPLERFARIKWVFYGIGPAAIWSWSLDGSRREMINGIQDALDTIAIRGFTDAPELDKPDTEDPPE